MSIGRNAQCPCGSGKKYKKCCGLASDPDSLSKNDPTKTWWFGYPDFKKKVYQEFADYFEEVLVPIGKLSEDTMRLAGKRMHELGDSATRLQIVIHHLAALNLQSHQEAVLLVG